MGFLFVCPFTGQVQAADAVWRLLAGFFHFVGSLTSGLPGGVKCCFHGIFGIGFGLLDGSGGGLFGVSGSFLGVGSHLVSLGLGFLCCSRGCTGGSVSGFFQAVACFSGGLLCRSSFSGRSLLRGSRGSGRRGRGFFFFAAGSQNGSGQQGGQQGGVLLHNVVQSRKGQRGKLF